MENIEAVVPSPVLYKFTNQVDSSELDNILAMYYQGVYSNSIGIMTAWNLEEDKEELILVGVTLDDNGKADCYPIAKVLEAEAVGNYLAPNGVGSYYDPLNKAIKANYKNNFNFRLGGEYKVDELAFRLGGSYSMNPYSSADLKGSYSSISGGVGYRKKGIFIDLTYVELFKKDVNFPYRLTDKENVYATTQQYSGSIILTMGFKF